jgi:hypothetical protein
MSTPVVNNSVTMSNNVIVVSVVAPFCDLTECPMDPTTFPLELLSEFIVYAMKVLDYGFPTSSIRGGFPTPPETPASRVKSMIEELAIKMCICTRCGSGVPGYSSCSNIEKETYEYLAGWCPTCFANFNHGAPFENSEIRAAFDWFELLFQNYDDVVLETEFTEDQYQDQEEVLDQEPFEVRADYSGDDMVFTTIVQTRRCLPRNLPTLRRI